MTELVVTALSSVCLCSVGVLLSKLCTIRAEVQSSEYVLMRKDHYEFLKTKASDEKYIIFDQPQIHEPSPVYDSTPDNDSMPVYASMPHYASIPVYEPIQLPVYRETDDTHPNTPLILPPPSFLMPL
jgi:hypothetical protein